MYVGLALWNCSFGSAEVGAARVEVVLVEGCNVKALARVELLEAGGWYNAGSIHGTRPLVGGVYCATGNSCKIECKLKRDEVVEISVGTNLVDRGSWRRVLGTYCVRN